MVDEWKPPIKQMSDGVARQIDMLLDYIIAKEANEAKKLGEKNEPSERV